MSLDQSTCRWKRIVATFAIASSLLPLLAFGPQASRAAAYSFTKVIDTTTVTSAGTLGSFTYTSVNGNRAAFLAFGAGGGVIGFGSGGPVTVVAKPGDPSPIGALTQFGTSQIPSIQGSDVAVWAINRDSTCICIGNGGSLTTVVAKGDAAPSNTFQSFGNPMQRGGNTAFSGQLDNGQDGVFIKQGGIFTAVAKEGDAAPSSFFNTFSDVAQDGTLVAFRATYSGKIGVFAGNGGPLTTIAQIGDTAPSNTFNDFSSLSVSEGKVAFIGRYDNATQSGILVASGGGLTSPIKTGDAAPSGTFGSLSIVSMVGDTFAFYGSDAGGQGIFYRKNGAIRSVLRQGDSLFGSSVMNLYFNVSSLDDAGTGTIGFGYILKDGQRGIALAVAVPEPSTVAMSVFAIASILYWKRLAR